MLISLDRDFMDPRMEDTPGRYYRKIFRLPLLTLSLEKMLSLYTQQQAMPDYGRVWMQEKPGQPFRLFRIMARSLSHIPASMGAYM
jgi:hypothetical protein